MIDVKHIKDNEYLIEWDVNDPIESQLNLWSESDFIDAIKQELEELKKHKLD